MLDQAALRRFLRAELRNEAATGFRRLRELPNMSLRHFLDYYESLGSISKDALAQAAVARAALHLAGLGWNQHEAAAWRAWRMEQSTNLHRDKYLYRSVATWRDALAVTAELRSKGMRTALSSAEEAYGRSIRGVKPPELRRSVAEVLKERHRLIAKNNGGGEWSYEAAAVEPGVRVDIDYGRRGVQLSYFVSLGGNPLLPLKRVSVESVYGICMGDWDFITVDNLEASMAALSRSIAYVSALPNRLASMPTVAADA